MCGIVGYVGPRDGVPIALEGLRRLEYRGYDSAGLAVVSKGALSVCKAAGKIRQLEARLPRRFKGNLVIGHTRWATHGEASDGNAHPHVDAAERIAVVHNGIVENASELRAMLIAGGVAFRTETDSEVLAHLIAASQADSLEAAVRDALAAVVGTYGLAVVSADQPDTIVVARNGSPVVLGVGQKEMYVASDVAALVRHTQNVVYLDDGEVAAVRAGDYRTTTLDAEPTEKRTIAVTWGQDAADRGEHEHFLIKEIVEQPAAVERTLRGRLDRRFHTAHLGGLHLSPREILEFRRIKILGCGSAYHAGMAGAHLLESLARVPADAEPASEFRYRNAVVERDALYIAVSQSGETLDTLAAVQEVKRKGGRVLGVVNAVGSTIARECAGGIYLHAGSEVSVASTKTFTCTSVAFALLALHVGRIRDLGPSDGRRLTEGLLALPRLIERVLEQRQQIAALARRYAQFDNAFFIGRASGLPIALEGAQKLKEVSYIHAEAYPAAELKHGPLALVSPQTPTFVLLQDDHLLDKNVSSISEIRARKGPVCAIVEEGAYERVAAHVDDVIVVPRAEPELVPILLGIPLQLLAYHAAVALERDVDRPRNLAKSVTVE